MKKILAIICALALMCSLSVVAFADDSVTTIYTGDTGYSGWKDVFEIYTTLWGGQLDPNFITEGGYLSVYFTGTEVWQIRLSLNGAQWTEIDWHVDEASRKAGTIQDLGDNKYVVTFTYDEIVAIYGTNDFAGTLGAVYVSTNGGGEITVTSVTYTVPGTEDNENNVPSGGDSIAVVVALMFASAAAVVVLGKKKF